MGINYFGEEFSKDLQYPDTHFHHTTTKKLESRMPDTPKDSPLRNRALDKKVAKAIKALDKVVTAFDRPGKTGAVYTSPTPLIK